VDEGGGVGFVAWFLGFFGSGCGFDGLAMFGSLDGRGFVRGGFVGGVVELDERGFEILCISIAIEWGVTVLCSNFPGSSFDDFFTDFMAEYPTGSK
jgi:hypothetical protein